MKTIITFLTFFSWTLNINAQTTKEIMLEIDKATIEINSNLKTYNKIEKNISADNYKNIYFNNKELKLISIKAIESSLEKNVYWYYIDGVLTYSETNWLDINTKKTIKHEKQYLKNGHLIAWINSNNNNVENTSSEFRSLETELTTYGEKLKSDIYK
ncbi:MAG: hypothetical protein IPI10_18745 [Bacteroidetes bacterium]|nr:hypothetical protein [Bacteroidota bacterium]